MPVDIGQLKRLYPHLGNSIDAYSRAGYSINEIQNELIKEFGYPRLIEDIKQLYPSLHESVESKYRKGESPHEILVNFKEMGFRATPTEAFMKSIKVSRQPIGLTEEPAPPTVRGVPAGEGPPSPEELPPGLAKPTAEEIEEATWRPPLGQLLTPEDRARIQYTPLGEPVELEEKFAGIPHVLPEYAEATTAVHPAKASLLEVAYPPHELKALREEQVAIASGVAGLAGITLAAATGAGIVGAIPALAALEPSSKAILISLIGSFFYGSAKPAKNFEEYTKNVIGEEAMWALWTAGGVAAGTALSPIISETWGKYADRYRNYLAAKSAKKIKLDKAAKEISKGNLPLASTIVHDESIAIAKNSNVPLGVQREAMWKAATKASEYVKRGEKIDWAAVNEEVLNIYRPVAEKLKEAQPMIKAVYRNEKKRLKKKAAPVAPAPEPPAPAVKKKPYEDV